MNKNECHWEQIHGFCGWSEYERFLQWMNEQIEGGSAEKIQVQKPMAVLLEEQWFRHVNSQKMWRLVKPDPPYKGQFTPLE